MPLDLGAARAILCDLDGTLIDSTDATGGVVALPGAADLLAADAPWGMEVAIVTSCRAPLADARLHATGLRMPSIVVTAERTERGKPHPDPYLLAAELLGLEPADCVVLEDAPAGIAAGRAAGMQVVAVRTSHADDELGDAHLIVDDAAAFAAMLPVRVAIELEMLGDDTI